MGHDHLNTVTFVTRAYSISKPKQLPNMARKFHRPAELNPSSMADIAFLLLIFFMVTAVMHQDKGLTLLLPPASTERPTTEIADRNMFTIRINSADRLMIEGELRATTEGMRDEIRQFILNRGAVATLSDSPYKAVVSLKADRGTSYKTYIQVLDEIQQVYYELYAEQAGISPKAYRALDPRKPKDKFLYEAGRKGIPMNISLAD